MHDVVVKALESVVVYGDLQRHQQMAVELQQGQVLQRRERKVERPCIHQRELLRGVIGIDESAPVRLPSQLEDGLVDEDAIEIDGYVQVVLYGEARLAPTRCVLGDVDVLALACRYCVPDLDVDETLHRGLFLCVVEVADSEGESGPALWVLAGVDAHHGYWEVLGLRGQRGCHLLPQLQLHSGGTSLQCDFQ